MEDLQRCTKPFVRVVDILPILTIVMVSWQYRSAEAQQIVHFKYMQFIAHQLLVLFFSHQVVSDSL